MAIQIRSDVVNDLEDMITNRLLMGAMGSLSTHAIKVSNLSDALSLAGDEPGHMSLQQDYGSGLDNWTGVRESVLGNLKYLARKVGAKDLLQTASSQLSDKAEHLLIDRGMRELCDHVSYDISIIFYYRQLKLEDADGLGPLLLTIYRAGGWPCGWRGTYPEGSILVYWPYT